MKIEDSICCDIIKDNIKMINKKLYILEKMMYNIDLNESDEYLFDIVSETIEEVKSHVSTISTITNSMCVYDEG